MTQLIAISGFSGAGKSLQGQKLAKELGFQYIDLDKYYIPTPLKPNIKLSDGTITPNFDSIEALNIKQFQKDILKLYKTPNSPGVIVTGFALRSTVLPFKPNHHLHILIDKHTSLKRRKQYKKFVKKNPAKEKRELMMINEVAYPFYLETLSNSEIDYFFDGLENPDLVYSKIKKYLQM